MFAFDAVEVVEHRQRRERRRDRVRIRRAVVARVRVGRTTRRRHSSRVSQATRGVRRQGGVGRERGAAAVEQGYRRGAVIAAAACHTRRTSRDGATGPTIHGEGSREVVRHCGGRGRVGTAVAHHNAVGGRAALIDAGQTVGLGDREIRRGATNLVGATVKATHRRARLVVDIERWRSQDGLGGC